MHVSSVSDVSCCPSRGFLASLRPPILPRVPLPATASTPRMVSHPPGKTERVGPHPNPPPPAGPSESFIAKFKVIEVPGKAGKKGSAGRPKAKKDAEASSNANTPTKVWIDRQLAG